MASICNTSCLIVFLVCISGVYGKSGFLQGVRRSFAQRLNIGSVRQELDAVLTEALGLGHGLTPAQQEEKMAQIRPMFETMPKNMHGRVSRDAMHYMAQRYFGYEHGWSIKGFDSSSTVNASESGSLSAKVLKSKLPAYVQSVVEQRLEREGFSLHDVVTLVVVMERMILDEGMQMLEDAYYLKEFETSALLTRNELMEVVFTYMLLYGFEADRRNRTDLSETMKQIRRQYPGGWASGMYGMDETKIVLEDMRNENPFAGNSGYSFEVAHQAVFKATQGYGKWSNEEECQELKGVLAELDRDGTGRVRLTEFYAKGSIGNNWFFEETPEYLRAQGVLDETSASRGMQLIIPNYVQAPSNCIEVSTFYSICCLKECDSLVGVIEREIQAPMASPARIVPVVQRIIDAKEEEPRNLTTQLMAQLETVAEHHMGEVPLHGRLFHQWLHYVFPLDCPYPQMRSEAIQSRVISEYSNRTGLPSVLTKKQMDKFIEENLAAEEEEEDDVAALVDREVREMSQWTMDEELYVGYHHTGPRSGIRDPDIWSMRNMLRSLASSGIIIGGVLSLRRSYRDLVGSDGTVRESCNEVLV